MIRCNLYASNINTKVLYGDKNKSSMLRSNVWTSNLKSMGNEGIELERYMIVKVKKVK